MYSHDMTISARISHGNIRNIEGFVPENFEMLSRRVTVLRHIRAGSVNTKAWSAAHGRRPSDDASCISSSCNGVPGVYGMLQELWFSRNPRPPEQAFTAVLPSYWTAM